MSGRAPATVVVTGVAGFIGSPPMNFLPATVEGTSVKMPFGTVSIPEDKAKKAQGKGLLIAGVRPEHFEDAAVMEAGKVEVVAGVNLPMLIKIASVRGDAPLTQVIHDAQEAGRKYINVASQVLNGK